MPALPKGRLWGVQHKAILNLERSLAHARPHALIQMATGSGKTFMAVTACHRLIKHAKASASSSSWTATTSGARP